ncbi:nucleotide disphospho-sugar-binding domain-containing protein [Lentzea guizhouensis]|nr:nucleotide disphospho-sugar-binding domain-containing protein [Lentzea guizhouensis]
MAVFLLPERGHVLPALGLVEELVRRGHRVSVPVPTGLAEAVASTGATPLYYDTTIDFPMPASLYLAAKEAFVEAEITLPVLEQVLREDPPDLVLWDITTWSGAVIARRLGVPDLLVESLLTSNEHWSLGDAAVPPGGFGPDVVEFFTRVHAFVGSALPEFLTGVRRRIALFPREFQPEGDTFGDWHAFVGPCLASRPFQASWQPPGGRVVLATAATEVCARAAEGMPWHLVTTGVPAAPNVEVHDDIPQLAVLEHASVFVTNGGMAGVMEALHHGVPMIVVPRMTDQCLNGQRVEELGLGVVLDTATPEGVRSLVDQLASDSAISARVKDMQRMIHRAGGSTAAADVVEEELAR